MKEQGIVIEKNGNNAAVRMDDGAVCSRCSSCDGYKNRTIVLSGKDAEGLEKGDKVEIEVDTSALLSVYSVLYLVPLVVFAGTSLIAFRILRDPAKSFFTALFLTVITYFVTGRKAGRRCRRKIKKINNNPHL